MDYPRVIEGDLQVRDQRFVILASRFNEFVVEGLVRGALDTLRRHGASDKQVDIVRVPGASIIRLYAAPSSTCSSFM